MKVEPNEFKAIYDSAILKAYRKVTSLITFDFDFFLWDLTSARRAYGQFKSVCDSLEEVKSTRAVCSDFNPNKWENIFSTITGACLMPLDALAAASKENELSASPLVQQLCLTSGSTGVSDIPGGDIVSNEENSLFGFLQSNDKYLTFSSFAGIAMSYTSTVTDALDFKTTFESKNTKEYTKESNMKQSLAANTIKLYGKYENAQTTSVSVGRLSNSVHDFERTVTINLGDNDDGEISWSDNDNCCDIIT